MVLCCCGQSGTDNSQVAARVNADEISVHQLTMALSKYVGKEGTGADRDAMLERLIDRQMAVQQAREKQLDRRPDVMLRLEEARRDILAAAFADEVASKSLPPDDHAILAYYFDHPGLFANRKVYHVREITVPSNSPLLQDTLSRLERKEPPVSILDWIHRQSGGFADQSAIRSAEQLPVEIVDRFSSLKPGDIISFRLPQTLVIYQYLSAEAAPISRDAAVPAIKTLLKNQKETALFKEELARLKKTAKIEHSAAAGK
jgi:EpsD family peptidyl-prolyl cis-trans isomerase